MSNLQTEMKKLHRRFGDNVIFCMADRPLNGISVIPTGSIALDRALGVGGVPRGRITEIYGPEGAGKTTLALSIAARAQRMGGMVAFIDMEHGLDWEYAKAMGITPSTFFIAQPETGEVALEIAEGLIRSGEMIVVVIDSVAALIPRAEVEGEMGDAHAGLQARLMSQAMRKLAFPLRQSQTALIVTNQLRTKIGVMFGNSETTTGGQALRFHASVRLRIQRVEAIKQAGQVIGSRIRAVIKKNKVAPPFRRAEFDLIFGQGFSPVDLLEVGMELGVVQRQERGFAYRDHTLGCYKRDAVAALLEDPELAFGIEHEIRVKLWPNGHDPMVKVPKEKIEDLESAGTPPKE